MVAVTGDDNSGAPAPTDSTGTGGTIAAGEQAAPEPVTAERDEDLAERDETAPDAGHATLVATDETAGEAAGEADDLSERRRHASIYALHRDLLALRRTDPVLARRPCRIDGAELADEAWMLRFFSESDGDRVLIVNLGRDLLLGPAPEPLLTGRGPCLATSVVQRSPSLRWFGRPGAGCRRKLAYSGPDRRGPLP